MTKEFVTPSPALLASLGTHKRDRPLGPVEVAQELQSFFRRGGRLEQLPVKEDTCREFLSLLDLPDAVQKTLGWGGVSRGEIGMYSGARISTLEKAEDEEALAKAVLERELTSNEVRRIVRHKNRRREKSIEECIETVVAMRPIRRHLFITELNEEVLKRLEKEAEARKVSTTNLLKEILSGEIPSGSLISLALRENFVMMFLDKEGHEELLRKVKEQRIRLKEVVDFIVLNRL
ncbi:MAG: hypothetical protein ACETV1_04850 [Candidatus Bathyarchaeia archaeon]